MMREMMLRTRRILRMMKPLPLILENIFTVLLRMESWDWDV